MRSVALRGLPVLLGDDPTEFFKACFASDDSYLCQHVPVGILSLENEDVALQPLSIHLHPSSVGIVLEGNVVMDNLDNIPQAMCLLFGLTYALHLDYPKCMGNTFLFIQQVLLGLGKKELKGKILAVTNQRTCKQVASRMEKDPRFTREMKLLPCIERMTLVRKFYLFPGL